VAEVPKPVVGSQEGRAGGDPAALFTTPDRERDGLEYVRSLGESAHALLKIFRAIGYDDAEAALQLNHRLAIARALGVVPGCRILEIGCGQGEMTATLAALVGEEGCVVGVDSAPADYGRPVCLKDAHRVIKAMSIGSRIDLRLGTDILTSDVDFPEAAFDLVILVHSIWYLGSSAVLRDLLGRARQWARRLGLAEWDLRATSPDQLAHVQAVMLQLHVQSAHLSAGRGPDVRWNIRNAIGAREAARLAGDAGWRIAQEHQLTTSASLRHGRVSEPEKAIAMARSAARDRSVDETCRQTPGAPWRTAPAARDLSSGWRCWPRPGPPAVSAPERRQARRRFHTQRRREPGASRITSVTAGASSWF